MTDYSQYGEQELILKGVGYNIDTNGAPMLVMPHEHVGRFLDIGAWNAKTFSNTRALYELGWSGVMVEPSPGPMHGLLKEYGNDPRITLIQAVCTPVTVERLLCMHVTDDALSTTNRQVHKLWQERGGYMGEILIPAIRIQALLRTSGPFDFVSIDAEGASVKLLFALFSFYERWQDIRPEWLPKCICVEHDHQQAEVIQRASGFGYQSHSTVINTILWRAQ